MLHTPPTDPVLRQRVLDDQRPQPPRRVCGPRALEVRLRLVCIDMDDMHVRAARAAMSLEQRYLNTVTDTVSLIKRRTLVCPLHLQ